uniref:Putative secreted protein n=1 Tax=Anopheles marajoara TaxID=58244 RepID=A0A2M4C8F2_9DIPT
MIQSVKFILLVVLFSPYFVQAQGEESFNPGKDEDTFDVTDEIFQNSSSQSDPKRAGRIVGGEDVLIADYLYVVTIVLTKTLQTSPFVIMLYEFVSGVIISSTQVLTVASSFNVQPSTY